MVAAHLGLGPRSITHAIQEYHPALLQVQCSVIGATHPGVPTQGAHPPSSLSLQGVLGRRPCSHQAEGWHWNLVRFSNISLVVRC